MSKPFVRMGLLAFVVLAFPTVFYFAWSYMTSDRVGRTVEAVAVVREDCQWLEIVTDGYRFTAGSGLPAAWRGHTFTGVLEVTEDHGDDSMKGIFTDSQGRSASVGGGVEDKYFSPLGCSVWAGG